MTKPIPPVTYACPCCGQSTPEPLSELVPLSEVQARLHIGRDVCHRMIRAGLIPGGIASGHKLLVARGPFERWLAGDPRGVIPAPVAPQPEGPVFLHRLPIGERRAG